MKSWKLYSDSDIKNLALTISFPLQNYIGPEYSILHETSALHSAFSRQYLLSDNFQDQVVMLLSMTVYINVRFERIQ